MNADPVVGLAVALASLMNEFGNMSILARAFMKDVLASGDRGRVGETVVDFRAFKVALRTSGASWPLSHIRQS